MTGWPQHDKLSASTEFEVVCRFLTHLRGAGVTFELDGRSVRCPGPELDRLAAEFAGVDYDRLLVEMDLIIDEAVTVAALAAEHEGAV